jgi:hypothetical protein
VTACLYVTEEEEAAEPPTIVPRPLMMRRPSHAPSILAEIYLRHACSDHEIDHALPCAEHFG